MSTPTLVPRNDTTVYLVLNDFVFGGRAYIETDESKADAWTIARKILDGQYSNPVRVAAFNLEEGWARDVTRDIAAAVFDLGSHESYFSQSAREFVESTLNISLFPVKTTGGR